MDIETIENKFQLLIDIIPDEYVYLIPPKDRKIGYSNVVEKSDVIKWKKEVISHSAFHTYNRMIFANMIWKSINGRN